MQKQIERHRPEYDVEFQERCRNLTHAEVYCCVTCEINELLQTDNNLVSIEDIENLYVVDADEDDEVMQEIYEWWKVSPRLIEDLRKRNEPVIAGLDLWGRTCTGQAVYMDGPIQSIVSELGRDW